MLRHLSLTLCCLLIGLGTAHAGYEEGVVAYNQGDYTTAHREFLAAARAGNLAAQGRLGGMYLYGAGVTKDLLQAYAWLDVAAGQGDTSAAKFRDAIAEQLNGAQMHAATALAEEYRAKYATAPDAAAGR